MESTQFGFIVTGLGKIESSSEGGRFLRSSQQRQAIQLQTIRLVSTRVQQIASHHLIDDFSFVIFLLNNQLQIGLLKVETGGNLYSQWDPLGYFQNMRSIFFRYHWQWRLAR